MTLYALFFVLPLSRKQKMNQMHEHDHHSFLPYFLSIQCQAGY
jgi:hypothetical protein